jgi:pyruvate-formate lyase-activating enzyme
VTIGLAYADARGRIYFDPRALPYADGGLERLPDPADLIPAPAGAIPVMLPGRRPHVAGPAGVRVERRRTALGALLPAGYTRLLLPAYDAEAGAPVLPLFGYAFACAIDDRLYVAAMQTDEDEDWMPRAFAAGELERSIAARRASDPANRVLAQLGICAAEYGCFTAQNVFLACGEAALPVSPKCNARCTGCISELPPEAGAVSPQTRIAYEATEDELARIALAHLERVPDGIVSFGQGCEGEPLLRAPAIARTIDRVRRVAVNGTINCNTNGSLPKSLQRLIDAGLDAVRISLNAFRPHTYAAYYNPIGYGLEDVLESAERAAAAGLRVSLNLLTHPGVTDEREEVEAMEAFLRRVRVDMVQTRTLNIDPHVYFAAVGRPREPIGMRRALASIRACGTRVGNFTHTH